MKTNLRAPNNVSLSTIPDYFCCIAILYISHMKAGNTYTGRINSAVMADRISLIAIIDDLGVFIKSFVASYKTVLLPFIVIFFLNNQLL